MRYTTRTTRIEALDIFRALTMFLMLFVNDIPGLKNIPHWLLHAKFDEDMLGFSDVIFPAFLFAMGMAVPFAILNREKKGESTFEVIGHILVRTIALLVMGVYTVNRDSFDGTAASFPFAWFSILMVVAFFLIWNVYPSSFGKGRYVIRGCQLIGVGILGYLFYIYKGTGGSSFSPQWWGILGLIGWVYLATSVLFLLFRQILALQLLAFLLICGYCVCSFMGIVPGWKWIGYLPAQAALYGFGSAGLVAGLLLKQIAGKYFRRYTIIMLILGIASLIAGVISHQYWIVSKIQGTPTWLFYCCAIFFPLFILVYWITDVKGQSHWFLPIKPAGTVTLTCYVIPYAWYSVESLLHVSYPAVWLSGMPGLIKSVVFSLLVIWLAGLLKLIGIRLKI